MFERLSELIKGELHGVFGGGAVHGHTLLVAQKKILRPEGQALVAAGTPVRDLAARPELWQNDGGARRVVKDRKVTDAYVALLVDELQASQAAHSTFKYHHSGTGVGAENQTDTALGTPVEDAREVGTQAEGATANIYRSVATITYTGTHAITEHGLFNGAGAGGPPVVGDTLMDRTVFSAINVVSGNAIELTFEISFTAGG